MGSEPGRYPTYHRYFVVTMEGLQRVLDDQKVLADAFTDAEYLRRGEAKPTEVELIGVQADSRGRGH